MILLALVALAFTFGMPKLMQNSTLRFLPPSVGMSQLTLSVDPEMREEFEKHSRSSPISGATRNAMAGGGGGPGNFDLAGWMAGASSGAGQSANSAEGATGRDTGSARRRG